MDRCSFHPARFLLLALLVPAGLVAPAAARADYIIDDFATPTTPSPYQIALLSSNPYTLTDPLGNGLTRTLTVQVLNPLPPDFDSLTGAIGGGVFRFNSESAATAVATLTYTGIGSAITGASGIDLSILKWDSGNGVTTAPVRITVTTGSGTLVYNGSIGDTASGYVYHAPFSAFSGSGDLGNVSSLQVVLNAPPGSNEATDLRINAVTAVPAPAGLLALASAAPVFVLARFVRRRKSAQ